MLKRLMLTKFELDSGVRAKFHGKVGASPISLTLESKICITGEKSIVYEGSQIENNNLSILENTMNFCSLNKVLFNPSKEGVERIKIDLFLDGPNWSEELPVILINSNPYLVEPVGGFMWPVEVLKGFKEGIPRILNVPLILTPFAHDGVMNPPPPISHALDRGTNRLYAVGIMTIVPSQKDTVPSFEDAFNDLVK